MKWRLLGVLLLIACAAALIPRETLIRSSAYVFSYKLSPDGTMVGFLADDENDIRNVFTLRVSDRQKRQVTFEKKNVIDYEWTGVKDIIIFEQDNDGDENTVLFKRNISENAPIDNKNIVCNIDGFSAIIFANNKQEPYVLVGLKELDSAYHNVYKFDLYTNRLKLVFTDRRFTSFHIFFDNKMSIAMTKEEQEDGSVVYYRLSSNATLDKLTSAADNWEEYLRVQPDDLPVVRFIGFDETNQNTYWVYPENTDLGCLIMAPLSDFSQRTVIHNATRAQLSTTDVVFHPKNHKILAVFEDYHKREFAFVDDEVEEDISNLVKLRPNSSIYFIRFSQDIQVWLVMYASAENPDETFIYRRDSMTAELLFEADPELKSFKLSKQIGFDFAARDGLIIPAYLSLPAETQLKIASEVAEEDRSLAEQGMIPAEPQKMVLLVHGGPALRDRYGYDRENAFLTSRGYVVLQVNYRGSTGFGKKHYNAGSGEWSRKMHDDLIDAVEFTISKRIANRSAVAIMGGSYGGYATLVGMTFTPDTFACGVDIVGPSNLVSLLKTFPSYWKGIRNSYYKMTGGNIETEEGRQELIDRSPLFIADRVKRPLMIIQGANDARVKKQESEQFVAALRNHSINVTYVLFPDEGHIVRRIPNKLAQFGLIEQFLHECLGGEYQPFMDGQYNESAIVDTFDFPPNTSLPIVDIHPSDSSGSLPRTLTNLLVLGFMICSHL